MFHHLGVKDKTTRKSLTTEFTWPSSMQVGHSGTMKSLYASPKWSMSTCYSVRLSSSVKCEWCTSPSGFVLGWVPVRSSSFAYWCHFELAAESHSWNLLRSTMCPLLQCTRLKSFSVRPPNRRDRRVTCRLPWSSNIWSLTWVESWCSDAPDCWKAFWCKPSTFLKWSINS